MNDTEYTEFYKSTFRAYDEPLAKTHFSLEGQVEFKALLYIPSVVSEIAIFSKILHSDPYLKYRVCSHGMLPCDQRDLTRMPRVLPPWVCVTPRIGLTTGMP